MRKIFFFGLIFITVSSFSQPWLYDLSKQKTTKEYRFYEIQNAFNRYWEDRTVEKGKGFKQFRRWEDFMEPRVFPSGEIPFEVMKEELLKALSSQEEAYASTWQFIGPVMVPKNINTGLRGGAGRLNCVSFHPADSNTIWVGAPTGGAWKSTNGGTTWMTTTDALASIGISDIAINPSNPNTIYLATGDGDYGSANIYGIGILKSLNGGSTWQPTGVTMDMNDFVNFRKIVFNPSNSNIILAAASNGIYRTTNGWTNYSIVRSGHFKDIEFNPGSSLIVYASSFSPSGNAKIYRSTDGGSTFSETLIGLNISGKVNRIELAVTPDNPSVIYALCSDASDDGFYGLYKSVNSGTSWSLVYGNSGINLLGWSALGSDKGGQGTYDLTLAVSPEDENEVYVGGVNLWRSTDGGKSWQVKGLWYHDEEADYVHADHHALLFSPHNPRALYSGNDGGIYKSYNKGESWQDLSDGLSILQVYRMDNSESDPSRIIAGNQDNGTIMKTGDTWQEILGGDGMECLFDQNNEDILYGTLYYGDIRKSTNGGNSFNVLTPDESLEGAWITPLTMHPEFSNILYAGYQSVYKSLNGGNTWLSMAPFPVSSGDLTLVEVAPANVNIVYAATRSTLFRTMNSGETWTDISEGLAGAAITALAVSETDPMEIWVTHSGYSNGEKVYHSKDGGETWSNYSDGLPNLPVNCVEYQYHSNNLLYTGTDIGVYYRDASMQQWVKYGSNLPNVIIYDLQILRDAKKLRAATHGRGIWETDIYEDLSQTYVDFRFSAPVVCLNGDVQFTSYSSAGFDSIQWIFGNGAVPSSAKGTGPHMVKYSTPGLKTVTINGYKGSTIYSETKTDIVQVTDEIDFTVSPDIYYACKGSSIVLNAGGGYDFTWSPSDFLDTTAGNTVVSTPDESITYTVTGTSGSCSVEKTVDLFITSNDDICDARLLNEGFNGPFNNQCATAQENEAVPPRGSAANSCESQDGWCEGETRIDNSVWFRFVAPEGGVVSFQTDGFDNQIAVYEADTCSDLLTGNYVFLAANDDYPGEIDYSATINEVSGLNPGQTYWLQVDGSYGGMTGTFSVTMNYARLSSTDDFVSEGGTISIYPNPNDGSFTVSYHISDADLMDVSVYNLAGLSVFKKQFYPEALSGRMKMNVDLPDGMYIIELKNSKHLIREKFILKK